MSGKERKDREKLQREKEILDAAESLLIEKGYEVMTMDEVAKRADFTKRTVYAYFTGKEDLYAAIMSRAMSYLNGLFEKAAGKQGTGLDRIEAIGYSFIDFARSGAKEFAVLCRSETGMGEMPDTPKVGALQKEYQKEMAIMGDAIAGGIADGSIRPDLDPTLTAIYLANFSSSMISAVSGSGLQMLAQFSITPEQFIEKGMEFFSLALTNKEYQPNKQGRKKELA